MCVGPRNLKNNFKRKDEGGTMVLEIQNFLPFGPNHGGAEGGKMVQLRLDLTLGGV